jgi:hypothetical protein
MSERGNNQPHEVCVRLILVALVRHYTAMHPQRARDTDKKPLASASPNLWEISISKTWLSDKLLFASCTPFINVGTINSLDDNMNFCKIYSITSGSHVWLLPCALCWVCGLRSWSVGCPWYQLLRRLLSLSIFGVIHWAAQYLGLQLFASLDLIHGPCSCT